MSGPSLINQTRDCAAAWNMTGDADPSHFAGNEFLDSPVALGNGTVFALVHTEFPGNDYHNCTGPACAFSLRAPCCARNCDPNIPLNANPTLNQQTRSAGR